MVTIRDGAADEANEPDGTRAATEAIPSVSVSAEAEIAERRSRLVGIKLRALVSEHVGREVPEAAPFAPGAAILDGDAAWVFLDQRPADRLGAALAWMVRSGAVRLHVVVDRPADHVADLADDDVADDDVADDARRADPVGDDDLARDARPADLAGRPGVIDAAGVLARRATAFRTPIEVWSADRRRLDRVAPAPVVASAAAPEHHESLRSLIIDGGAEPVVEHGVLAGEVRGLEVCRVVDDAGSGTTRLEVGVGEHDREAFQLLHGDVPTVESLARVVASVARHRSVDAPPHPLKSLGAERLLRWRIEQAPEMVAAAILSSAPPPVRRVNLKDPVPCVASGVGDDGRPVIVVCSTGVELDVVPYAADARLALGETGVAGGRLVIALPTRDRIGIVDEIAALLDEPVEIVSID